MTRLLAFFAASRSWWLLLIVAAIGAGLYAWGAEGRADRDAVIAWSARACATAGAEFTPAKSARGKLCEARLRELARFERDTNAATAGTLAQAMVDHDSKMTGDAASARRDAAAARAATERMEKANATVSGDRVDREWLAALNELAGLR